MLEQDLGLKTEKKLGQGGQGLVLLCQQPATGKHFACKAIASHARRRARHPSWTSNSSSKDGGAQKVPINMMSSLEAAQNDGLRWEAEVLEHLRGLPGILPISAKAESDDGCMHIFTPLCDGGDLHARLDDSAGGVFPEREAAYVVAQLAQALLSCHRKGIVHLDLKPANVLFRSRMFDISTDVPTYSSATSSVLESSLKPEPNGFSVQQQPASSYQVFLADFGHAASLEYIEPGRRREMLHDPNVGTLPFNAPEVIRKCYDHSADIWSLGLILHLMLTSQLPSFLHCLTKDASETAIRRAILSFDNTDQQQLHNMQDDALLEYYGVSLSAQSLLRGMLCKDPTSRITLQQVLQHPWVTGNTINQELLLSTAIYKPAGAAVDHPVPAPAAPPNYGMASRADDRLGRIVPPAALSTILLEDSDSCRIITAMEFRGQGISSRSKNCTSILMPEEYLQDAGSGSVIGCQSSSLTTLEGSDSCRIISCAMYFNIMQGISPKSCTYTKKRKLLPEDELEEEAFPRFTRAKPTAATGGFSCFQQQDYDVIWL